MRKALVVEQDRDILAELESALVTLGFQVTVLTKPDETQMALEQERYEVASISPRPDQPGGRP